LVDIFKNDLVSKVKKLSKSQIKKIRNKLKLLEEQLPQVIPDEDSDDSNDILDLNE
jgi:DNA-directed RNA polymerase subunit H (RpoH/RPB5)